MFIVPGSMRPIINLWELNKFIHWVAFEDGRDLSGAGGGLDGQDRPQGCLFCRPHRSTSPPFLRFHDLPVQLPPIQAVLCAGPKFSQIYVAAWLRQLGCWMTNYIKNNLLMANTKEEAKLMGELAVTLLEQLGFQSPY